MSQLATRQREKSAYPGGDTPLRRNRARAVKWLMSDYEAVVFIVIVAAMVALAVAVAWP